MYIVYLGEIKFFSVLFCSEEVYVFFISFDSLLVNLSRKRLIQDDTYKNTPIVSKHWKHTHKHTTLKRNHTYMYTHTRTYCFTHINVHARELQKRNKTNTKVALTKRVRLRMVSSKATT